MQRKLPIVSVNGIIDAQISPLDRGFNYGDGVFETCKVTNAKIPLWCFHRERLLNACEKLRIPVDVNVIENQVAGLMASVDEEHKPSAVLKIIVTRGQGGRGYGFPNLVTPTIVIGVFPAAQYPHSYFSEGIDVRLCQQRLLCNPSLAGLKHLNRLEQILARAEWQDEKITEGIMLDVNGFVIEAVFSNIFFVKAGELFTPDLSQAGVAGVMRRFIIEKLAPEIDITTHIKQTTLVELTEADEIFLCNSNYGVWPVKTFIGGRSHEFAVGVVSKRLQDQLALSLAQESSLSFN